MIFIAAVFAAFGLIVGSFLNVVILRFGERDLGGRSGCPSCGTILHSYDLIPVVSWLALRGKCRYCGAGISIQYPLVEASTAILFAAIGLSQLPVIPTVLALAIASLLLCIFVYDLYHQLIPDLWVYAFCICALAFSLSTINYQLSTVLAGFFAALPIFFLWALSLPFTGLLGSWMGFGDVKLALGIGWLLPQSLVFAVPLGLFAVMFSFIIGAVISVAILLPLPHILAACGIRHKQGSKGYTMKSEVPFGPFLIVSCILVWFASMYGISIPLFV